MKAFLVHNQGGIMDFMKKPTSEWADGVVKNVRKIMFLTPLLALVVGFGMTYQSNLLLSAISAGAATIVTIFVTMYGAKAAIIAVAALLDEIRGMKF